MRERRRTIPDYARTKYLAGKGVTVETYLQMLADQGAVCAVCGEECATGSHLSIDHDHDCDLHGLERTCVKCIRGLTCRSCNIGMGNLGDDPERLEAAARYLRRHRREIQGE